MTTTTTHTVADAIAQACARHGVKRAFGVPGGGSSLDLIAAFARQGIDFHLCRTETGATLMAGADAEIRHGFGVAIATQGPGAASAMNGLAHASLDRAPVLFVSDGWTARQSAFDTHQVFDQRAMSSPVVKGFSRLESEAPGDEIEALIDTMRTAPWGPVHIELTKENAGRAVASRPLTAASSVRYAPAVSVQGEPHALLARARRPVLLVGLEARDDGAAAQILALAQRLRCPVLTTYKAKGLVSDAFEGLVGHFTGGAAERDCVAQADLIVLCGLDPVELIGRPWPYTAPVLDIGLAAHPVHYVMPAAAMHGPLALHLGSLRPDAQPSDWRPDEIDALRYAMRERLAFASGGPGLSPQLVVERAMQAVGPVRPAITVDAGAHMFSAMAFWQATAAGSALISNGLATMAYALPAGIARALHAPETPTIAFTGDGGLAMCAGELATAVQAKARLCVVVFNDSTLSLIAIKQRDRGMADAGVRPSAVDFTSVARGFGLKAFCATNEAEYAAALHDALASEAPCLIDVLVDPTGYRAQAKALRG